MPRIAILDTYYPDFLHSWRFRASASYQDQLDDLLRFEFGTGDFYSTHLRALGWECLDIIANCEPLQQKWADEHRVVGTRTYDGIVAFQLQDFKPDVVFCQNLNLVEPDWKDRYRLAGQLSCPWPGDTRVRPFHILFSSFPHYVSRIQAQHVQPVYLPLAFDPRMRQYESPERDIEIGFVGGVGKDLHWRRGTDTLEAVAQRFPDQFRWYGYGMERLDPKSALARCWRGYVWGRDVYKIYARSKIVVNRHGEVAEGFANNLRLFEATGMGALVLTEDAINLPELFPVGTIETYRDMDELCTKIHYYLGHFKERIAIAVDGQERTLTHHTYAQRMRIVSDILVRSLEAVHP